MRSAGEIAAPVGFGACFSGSGARVADAGVIAGAVVVAGDDGDAAGMEAGAGAVSGADRAHAVASVNAASAHGTSAGRVARAKGYVVITRSSGRVREVRESPTAANETERRASSQRRRHGPR